MYVIVRTADGAFVSKPGSARSYTSKLQHARTWASRDAAEAERCPGNEHVVPLESCLNRPE